MPTPYVENFGVATVTSATVTVTAAAHAGKTIVFNRAAGVTATLPAATGSGVRFRFTGIVDASGSQIVQVTGNDVMQGQAALGNDAAGSSNFYTADTSDTITLNGTTKGGYKGWIIDVQDVAADTWLVYVVSEASGSEETPFSAAVS